MRHSLLLITLLPFLAPAQNLVLDQVLFWDSVEWEHTEIVYYYPHEEAVPWIIRRYFGDRRDVREELIRLDDRNWLYNAYDTAGVWRRRTGRLTIDAAHPQIDSVLTFHPDTYDEWTRVDTTWRLQADGIWEETDSAGFRWGGPYAAGKKHGRWSKLRYLTRDITDLRTVEYDRGAVIAETQHNLALAGDAGAVRAALAGSWTFCDNRRSLFWWYRWSTMPGGKCFNHHGSVAYFFLENGAIQGCFPNGFTDTTVKMGVWRLTDDLDLFIDWDDGARTRHHVRSLMGDELILE